MLASDWRSSTYIWGLRPIMVAAEGVSERYDAKGAMKDYRRGIHL